MGARRKRRHGERVGVTDHAQAQLGDLVYLELPAVGRKVAAEEACAVVESVKAASDVYAPLAGEVIAINDALANAPEQVNQDAVRCLALQAEAGRCDRLCGSCSTQRRMKP